MPKRKGTRKGKGKRKVGRRRKTAVTRSPGIPFRTEEWISLKWNKRNNITNIGNNNANYSLLVTQPLNVDVPQTASSSQIPFWDSSAARYRQYRVSGASVYCTFANREAFPVTLVLTAVNKAVAQNDTSFDEYFDQPNTKRKFIGPLTGNGIGKMRGSWSTGSFAGAPNTRALDFYVGNTDPSGPQPTNNWYILVGVTANSPLTAAGCDVDILVRFKIRFFEVSDEVS